MTDSEKLTRAELRLKLLQLPLIDFNQVMIVADCGETMARDILRDCDSYGKPSGPKLVEPSQVIAWLKQNKREGKLSSKKAVASKAFSLKKNQTA